MKLSDYFSTHEEQVVSSASVQAVASVAAKAWKHLRTAPENKIHLIST